MSLFFPKLDLLNALFPEGGKGHSSSVHPTILFGETLEEVESKLLFQGTEDPLLHYPPQKSLSEPKAEPLDISLTPALHQEEPDQPDLLPRLPNEAPRLDQSRQLDESRHPGEDRHPSETVPAGRQGGDPGRKLLSVEQNNNQEETLVPYSPKTQSSDASGEQVFLPQEEILKTSPLKSEIALGKQESDLDPDVSSKQGIAPIQVRDVRNPEIDRKPAEDIDQQEFRQRPVETKNVRFSPVTAADKPLQERQVNDLDPSFRWDDKKISQNRTYSRPIPVEDADPTHLLVKKEAASEVPLPVRRELDQPTKPVGTPVLEIKETLTAEVTQKPSSRTEPTLLQTRSQAPVEFSRPLGDESLLSSIKDTIDFKPAFSVLGDVLPTELVRETFREALSLERSLPQPATQKLILDQVIREFRVVQEAGRSEVQMTLEPKEFGHLRMNMTVEDSRVNVQFHVENATVKTILQSNLPQLRSSLAEQGMAVNQVDVQVDGFAAGAGHDKQNQQSWLKPVPLRVVEENEEIHTFSETDRVSSKRTVDVLV